MGRHSYCQTRTDIVASFILSEMISRTLPRGQQCLNLIQCTTDEQSYRENEAAVSMLVNHPDVDGVYEAQVPHLVRALIRLGNKCNPAAHSGASLSRGLDQGFNLTDLATTQHILNRRRYLDAGRNLQYVYLYHSNQDSRHVVCLVLPNGEARLYIVDKGRNRELPNMENYYVEAKTAFDARQSQDPSRKGVTELVNYPARLKVDVTYHAEPEVVYKSLSKELLGLQSRKQGPTVVAICSAKPRLHYESRIKALQQYPTILIPSSKVDNTYPTRLLWQAPAAKRMVQHYLRLSQWLKDKMEVAHRADIPM